MTRFPDWPTRLQHLMTERWRQPFVWGVNDCALLACDAVLAMTGEDPAEAVRGEYSNETQARNLLRSMTDGGGLEEYAALRAEAYGLDEVGWRKMRRGDVGLIDTPDGGALGICWPSGKLAFPGPKECVLIPVRMAKRGWRIG